MDIVESKLDKLRQIFKANKVQFACVFGSAVKGGSNNASDVDIAVFLDEPNKFKRFDTRLKLANEIEKIISKKVDLVVLNDIESLFFKYIIISEGKNIFENSRSKRIEIECKIYSEYLDFKPFLDNYHANFLNKKIHA